jgi:murein DD-endopeptidase MepM/ murein hydrolase activator NlpD
MVNNNSGMKSKFVADGTAMTAYRWARRVLVLCGGFGLASGGSAVAQTATSPEMEDSVHTSAEYLLPTDSNTHRVSVGSETTVIQPTAPAPSPQFSSPRSTAPQTSSSSAASKPMQTPAPPPPTPTVVMPAPERAPAMAESLLQPSVPNSDTAPQSVPSPVVPSQVAADESVPAGFNSVFIDPTNYNVGATQTPAAPDIVFTERSTGCQMTVSAGQGVPNATCGTTAASGGQTTQVASGSGSGSGGGVQVGPISIGPRGVSLGSTTVVSREFLNEKLRPLNILRRGDEEYVFPLSIPAPITSLFGWRMHPIHQSWRFHSGTDLAAPTGHARAGHPSWPGRRI